MLAITIIVWGIAAGVLLWGSGWDESLHVALFVAYDQSFNDCMRVLGDIGKGASQAVLCLLVGLWLGQRARMRHQGLRGRLQLTVRWLLGVLDQLQLLLRGKFVWTRYWRELPMRARVWLLVVPVFLIAGIMNIVLKVLVGRPRPKEVMWNGVNGYELHPLTFDAGFWSFPSGHAVSMFAIATVLAMAWPKWGWVIWPVALVFSISRFLAMTPHYAGDVIAGAAIGMAIGLVVARGMKVEVAHGR